MKPDAGVINIHVDLYSVEDDSSTVNLEERCICTFDRFLNFLFGRSEVFWGIFPLRGRISGIGEMIGGMSPISPTTMHGTVF